MADTRNPVPDAVLEMTTRIVVAAVGANPNNRAMSPEDVSKLFKAVAVQINELRERG